VNVIDPNGDVILWNVNGPEVDKTPMNANDPSVDETLVSMSDPDINGNQTDWTLLRIDSPHYLLSFLGHLGPFSRAYPLSPTLNLSPICITAPIPHLSHQIASAPKHLVLFGGFSTTPF